MRHYTLVFLVQENLLLLGKKKRGFGKDKWNGFGGKVEKGETILEAAHREVHEECGLLMGQTKKMAELFFTFEDNPLPMFCHVFVSKDFSGLAIETEEMSPQWFTFTHIPFDLMWQDDYFWLPRVLGGEKLRGEFHFNATEKMLAWSVVSVDKASMGRGFLVAPDAYV